MHTPDGDSPDQLARQPADQPQESDAAARALPIAQPPIHAGPPPVNEFFQPATPALPADLITPLTGVDLLVIGIFYFVAGAVITLLVSIAAMSLFGIPRSAVRTGPLGLNASLVIVSQALLSGAVLALLFGMVRSRGTADFWPSVGWRAFPGKRPPAASIVRYLLIGAILAVAMGFISAYLDRNLVLPMEELLRDRQSVLLLTALGLLIAPLFEETIFRGCIYPVLARRWGTATSVLATGILFGTAHAQQLWPGYGQIALLMFVGIVLTYIRARTGTVAASYFVHLGYNTITFAGFFATGGLRHFSS